MNVMSDLDGTLERGALDIKAASFMLPVIRLRQSSLKAINKTLEEKIAQAPGFFRHTPVVIDLTELPPEESVPRLAELVDLLRALGMVPIGLRGGDARYRETARAMRLAILTEPIRGLPRAESTAPTTPATTENPPAPVVPALELPTVAAGLNQDEPQVGIEVGSTLIMRPVRSGQKVYNTGGDLTVLAAVNAGAELMADGNIHVYGPLRGRVFAGMKGNQRARIFCLDLQAELVAIAGHYRVSENIAPELKGARVQIFLEQDTLRIERI